MKKRNFLSMLLALSLVGVIMVGASLAYLTDRTEDVVNTFTVGNVKISLTEPHWEPEKGQDLEPGAVVPKDPIVTNTGKNNAYVMVEVDGMAEMIASGFSATVNKTVWQKVDQSGVADAAWDGSLQDGFYVYTEKALVPKEVTSQALFDNVVFAEDADSFFQEFVINEIAVDEKDESKGTYFTIDGVDGTFATKAEAEAKVAELEGKRTYQFDLVLRAYAIQEKGFEIKNGNVFEWVSEIFTAIP